MFATDLSWQKAESVGEHKERKTRQRSSGTPSIRTSVTSRSSSSTDRQQWWTSGLKKVKAKASSKSMKTRPTTSPNPTSQQNVDPPSLHSVCESSIGDFPTWELQLPHHLEEPSLQPACAPSKSVPPSLPSGGSMDLLECDVPELEGDMSSRYTHSIVSMSSRMLKTFHTREVE